MNRIILFFLFSFQTYAALAQVDRTRVPEPGPAPDIELGEYETFVLDNGLTVFVVEDDKLPVVTYQLIIDRDPVLEGERTGYVALTGKLLHEGTTNRSKMELDEAIDFIGGQLSISGTSVFASSLSEYKDQMFALMADAILNPAFPSEALEKLKVQEISDLRAGEKDPVQIAFRVRDRLLYGSSHPYGELVTQETLNNITLEDCKQYYETFFRPNRSYLAMVGDINKEEAEQLVDKYLGDWQKMGAPDMTYEKPQNPEQTEIAFIDHENAVQSIIVIGHVIELPPGSEDAIPMRVANQILGGSGGRLFKNLRDDKGYTYGSGSRYEMDPEVGKFYAVAGVRNEVTDSAITEMLFEMNRIREEQISVSELESAQQYITGEFARSLEDPRTIANFAIDTRRYNLPEDYYSNYLNALQDVTTEQVQQIANKYILPDHCTVVVVGQRDQVAEGLDRLGKLKYYDIRGNLIKTSEKD